MFSFQFVWVWNFINIEAYAEAKVARLRFKNKWTLKVFKRLTTTFSLPTNVIWTIHGFFNLPIFLFISQLKISEYLHVSEIEAEFKYTRNFQKNLAATFQAKLFHPQPSIQSSSIEAS